MIAVALGFVGAVMFGGADFVGGLAAKRMSAVKVTFVSGLAGFCVATIGSFVVPSVLSWPALFWGGMAGVVGSAAIMLLYASLAIGPMSILSPLGAFVSAVVPVTWALLSGESLGAFGFAGIGLGLVAVVLVGVIPEKNAVRASAKGLTMSIGAGILIGAFLICMAQAPSNAGLIPLVANRIVSATIMGSTIAVIAGMRALRRGWKPGLQLAVLVGLIDGSGNALLLLGIQLGDLSVMSVLTAMYPIGTILLAGIVLKERVAPLQAIGLVMAVAAAALLAIG
ncbi:MAG: EamA/RhaT family transporter [Microbacteriaceae bacterium]|nr:EamA/RhaT family transporter [Microbacteriaceae bacterium]